MNFEEKLKTMSQQQLWDEYCDFLDLSMEEYMAIQQRLLMEQIDLLSKCTLGRNLFGDKPPKTMDEFRRQVRLTQFEDYAEILLRKRDDMLPAPPAVWMETTWEGGSHPFKCAPYTEAMLETFRTNILATMLLATARKKGNFVVRPNARVLFSLAPLPYVTGLFPGLVDPEIRIKFLPAVNEAHKLSFAQRCKKGFLMSMQGGMDQFYGMTSIVYNMSKNFELSPGKGGLKSVLGMKLQMIYRLLKAKYISKRDNRPLRPGDLFRLDAFVVMGTDTAIYKDELERLWGCRPLEICGGTEPSLLGTENWNKNGLVFFPDNCFYEFIPEQDMLKSMSDSSYIPPTYLMNELVAGEKYELVITNFKGGAFARYRVGDVYRCIRTKNPQDKMDFPQFEYIDRVPNVIDISGFTRITRREIDKVIDLAGLPVTDYIAGKEYDEEGHSFLRLYVEMDDGNKRSASIDAELFKNHLGIYFRYHDSDYNDLKRLLGIDPLQVTLLRHGTIADFEAESGRTLGRINPRRQDILDLLAFRERGKEVQRV